MQVKPGRLSGLFHIYPQVYRDERGLCWDVPALQIPWFVETPILSEKDQQGLTLEALRACGYC